MTAPLNCSTHVRTAGEKLKLEYKIILIVAIPFLLIALQIPSGGCFISSSSCCSQAETTMQQM
jgi:hypothetical protein